MRAIVPLVLASVMLDHPATSVVVLTTIPLVPQVFPADPKKDHVVESLLALGAMCSEAGIEHVRVLLDEVHTDDASPTAHLRSAVARAAAQYTDRASVIIRHLNASDASGAAGSHATNLVQALEKLEAMVFGRQPTYADMFRHAGEAFPGRLVAVANADIVLRGAHRLDAAAFAEGGADGRRPLALALSATVVKGAGCGDDLCGKFPMGWSWDVHVFRAPLARGFDYALLEALPPAPVFMNAMGAEGRVGFALASAGYELLNPCVDVAAEHWHCAPKTHAKPAAAARGNEGTTAAVPAAAIAASVSGAAPSTTGDSFPVTAAAGRVSGLSTGVPRRARRGLAKAARVDAAVGNSAVLAAMDATVRRFGHKGLPANSTRFFWVPRTPAGRGILSHT